MAAEERYIEPTPPSPHWLDERRAALVGLAAELADAGVPAELLMEDVRAGVARAVMRRGRSGR